MPRSLSTSLLRPATNVHICAGQGRSGLVTHPATWKRPSWCTTLTRCGQALPRIVLGAARLEVQQGHSREGRGLQAVSDSLNYLRSSQKATARCCTAVRLSSAEFPAVALQTVARAREGSRHCRGCSPDYTELSGPFAVHEVSEDVQKTGEALTSRDFKRTEQPFAA